jgi:hypothetical protein
MAEAANNYNPFVSIEVEKRGSAFPAASRLRPVLSDCLGRQSKGSKRTDRVKGGEMKQRFRKAITGNRG